MNATGGLSETIFVRAILDLWKAVKETGKKPDTRTIMQAGGGLLSATAKKLSKSLAEGFKLAETEPSTELTNRLTQDVWVFSGFKTHAQLSEVSAKLFQDGKVRPWSQFKNDVLDIHPKYNTHYLEAEYHHAVGSSQMAAKWEKFEREKDRYNLRYRATRDDRTRPTHDKMHGITLPVDDPFWDKFMPPNGWRCRCSVFQVKASEKTTDPKKAMELGEAATYQEGRNGENRAEMFRFNPGKEKAVFPQHHPYYKSKEKLRITGESLKQFFGGFSKGQKQISADKIKVKGKTLIEKLKSVEDQIFKGENEVGFVFDAKGKLIKFETGTRDGVQLIPDFPEQFKDCIVTHNHPSYTVLSTTDIIFSIREKVKQIRAVAGDEIFLIDMKPGINLNEAADILDDLLEDADEGDLSPAQYHEYLRHDVSYDFVKKLGLKIVKAKR